jgi:hypothetical protein
MRDARRFAIGSGAYTCAMCGRRTRSTGRGDNEHAGLCAECFDLAGEDNQHNDDGTEPTAAQLVWYNDLLQIIADRGGDAAKVKRTCSYLWVEEPVAAERERRLQAIEFAADQS